MEYVEIKTRVATSIIDLVESIMKQHGIIVWCLYGDDTFKGCVPSGNRGQVIHQTCVGNFSHNFYGTAKVEEEDRSIVQITILKFAQIGVDEYKSLLYPVTRLFLGWFYTPELMLKGYLEDNDYPSWLDDDNNRTLAVIDSCSKKFYAYYKKILKVLSTNIWSQ